MAEHRTTRRAISGRPPWPLCFIRPARVESQPGNDQKHVALPRINADPVTGPTFAVASESARGHAIADQSRLAENIRSGARAIETAIHILPMATSETIWRPRNGIARRNRRLDAERSPRRCHRLTIGERRRLPRDIAIDVGRPRAADEHEERENP